LRGSIFLCYKFHHSFLRNVWNFLCSFNVNSTLFFGKGEEQVHQIFLITKLKRKKKKGFFLFLNYLIIKTHCLRDHEMSGYRAPMWRQGIWDKTETEENLVEGAAGLSSWREPVISYVFVVVALLVVGRDSNFRGKDMSQGYLGLFLSCTFIIIIIFFSISFFPLIMWERRDLCVLLGKLVRN
jgi:hypothetical protein